MARSGEGNLWVRGIAGLFLPAILLSACVAPPESPEAGAAGSVASVPDSPDWLAAAGRDLQLDSDNSEIRLRVYRAGRLAHLGHNHVIEVGDLRGRVRQLSDGGMAARLRFRADRLRVDDPEARAAAGDAFAGMPDDSAVAGTRRNLLGARVLDALQWPEIVVTARIEEVSTGSASGRLLIKLRGGVYRTETPMSVMRNGDAVVVRGHLVLRQSDLGMTPFSVFGGALSVRDELEVDFVIVGHNSGPLL